MHWIQGWCFNLDGLRCKRWIRVHFPKWLAVPYSRGMVLVVWCFGSGLLFSAWENNAHAQRFRHESIQITQQNRPQALGPSTQQTDPQQVFQDALRNLRGKQGIHLLTLPFFSDDIDAAITKKLSDSFLKNLRNTGRFVIVQQPQSQIKEGPILPNPQTTAAINQKTACAEIACGVALAKQLRADQVLEGRLSGVASQVKGEELQYRLRLRLVDAINNQLEHEEILVFYPAQQSETLYALANQLSANLLQRGRVLRVSNPTQVLVGLGSEHGIKTGERMVVLRNLTLENEGERAELELQPIALVKVVRVHARTSQVSTLQAAIEVRAADYVHAYQNPLRRVELLATARRSLDEAWRDQLAILEPKVDLTPVLVEDVERLDWLRKRAQVIGQKQFWSMMSWVAGGITLLGLVNFDSDSSRLAILIVSGGVGVHSLLRWKRANSALDVLNVKGRTKNWLGDSGHVAPLDLIGQGVEPSGIQPQQTALQSSPHLNWYWRF